ncbi:MAG: minor capsid protein [Selenomonadaceae bacterium]|nr:minor capsid protein [Selenomonadaceae bacterium]
MSINQSMKDFLTEAYTSNYSRNIFDLVKVGGLSVALAKVENINAERVLAARWSGKNYSQRIWKNTRLLSNAIKQTITAGVHRGLSIPQLSKMLDNKMQSGYKNAVRLIRTEMNFVNNQAHYDSMKAAEVEMYEFISVLDGRTSQKCREKDGETFLLSEKQTGVNYPPLHARCRSTVAPFIEGASKSGNRVAKDKNGKYIDIPASMRYADYEKVYIKKEKSLDEWNRTNQKKVSSKVTAESKIAEIFKGLAASDNTTGTNIGKSPVKLGEIPDKNLIRQTLEYFEKQIVNSNVENAIVITSSNEVYQCVGDKNNVNSILELGDKLKGAYVTHNHPIGSDGDYSFSNDDIRLFTNYGLSILRGIDEKFIYELNRNPIDLDIDNFTIDDLLNNADKFINRHVSVIDIAKKLCIGYRRWKR